MRNLLWLACITASGLTVPAATREAIGTGCTPASSGHFVASEGASQEERCPKGRHASGGGSSACAPCEPGKYADEEGLGECKAARATSPEKCEVGG